MNDDSQELPKAFGFWSGAALVAASMIGTGILLTPGYTAAALGINIRRVFTLTFAAGAGLAGLGGALMVPIRGLLPTMGLDILPVAFVVVVLGGLGSLPGAILAGLLVGVVQSLMTAIWAPGADASVFALMTLGIIARPQGLLGQR